MLVGGGEGEGVTAPLSTDHELACASCPPVKQGQGLGVHCALAVGRR